jgi:hypothetical protein
VFAFKTHKTIIVGKTCTNLNLVLQAGKGMA